MRDSYDPNFMDLNPSEEGDEAFEVFKRDEELREIKDVHIALGKIIAVAPFTNAVNWAVNYARFGLTLSKREDIELQCLYVLGNIETWRGDEAKEVRNTLKRFCHMPISKERKR